jgi:4-hydroxybenzoate polyprenyltransferase
MDKVDHGLQMLKPEAVKAGLSRVARIISENAAVRAVTAYTDTQITRVANSAAMERLRQYAILVRLNKPIGILLLLWPTMISLWIAAQGWPDTKVLLVFVMGVILMRSAGCAINDYADRDIDGSVARTKDRPLVSGKVSEKEALIVFATLSICAFGLVLLMKWLTIMMSLVGVVLAASYPFMKRYHFLPQVHLGAAFGWAVPMAYTAQANELTPVTWLLFLATVLWTTAYDTMYAMADREDDLKIGVKSTAILFGPLDKKIIGAIQAMLIMALILIGQRAELSGFYYAGVVAATVLAIWQQYLIKDREPTRCFEAFLNNNWFGLVLFIGLVLDYQFKGIT